MPSRDRPSSHGRLRRASRPKAEKQFLPIGIRDPIAVEIGHDSSIGQVSRRAPRRCQRHQIRDTRLSFTASHATSRPRQRGNEGRGTASKSPLRQLRGLGCREDRGGMSSVRSSDRFRGCTGVRFSMPLAQAAGRFGCERLVVAAAVELPANTSSSMRIAILMASDFNVDDEDDWRGQHMLMSCPCHG